jgi:hypothetical protein
VSAAKTASPCDLLAELLYEVFDLSDEDSFIHFQTNVCLLRHVQLPQSEEELVCFFLNLYHLLVTHASLVFGCPTNVIEVCVIVIVIAPPLRITASADSSSQSLCDERPMRSASRLSCRDALTPSAFATGRWRRLFNR